MRDLSLLFASNHNKASTLLQGFCHLGLHRLRATRQPKFATDAEAVAGCLACKALLCPVILFMFIDAAADTVSLQLLTLLLTLAPFSV